ncbi:tRNA-aminoacylation cofactor ARC1 [Wickerhamiella sorbophila]|uniref:tRNA-aminoacylation cofactor ARC1 n=1 Tax=Wickerhamiella sorbophila TaxID=45607 RepID=A0A2T0FDQ1_9ASCO|nr:tRNA-aminoacylation cofactor ARC1 [Wickerhamiella sorbophila]PRT53134.1 tRNA-aminoacylation cofactor ARC1 [Wickerhamiella sorbophila]
MSDVTALTELFSKVLKIQPSNDDILKEIKFESFTASQQALIHQSLTLSSRLPESLPEMNDVLRQSTYMLNTQKPTEIDSVVFGRAERFVRKFSNEDAVTHRHVVRWADLVQNRLKVDDKIAFELDLAAPREIKKKETKDAKDAKPKESKKEVKIKEETKEAKPEDAKSAEDAKKAKKEKKEKAKAKKDPVAARPVTPGMIDLRVGFIQKAVKHPDADSLYVSTIDVGEDEPRTICSGLVSYVPIEDMQQRYIVVVANLKPVKMRGISSNGMVLCASNKEDGVVEFVNPPADSKPGDKLFFETYDEEPEAQLNPKKKIFETIQPSFSTNENLEVIFKKEGEPDRKLINKKGEALKCSTLVGANVS